VIWAADLVLDFQGKPGDFGYSESPVVDDKHIYCFTGGSVHNIVALDRKTGALAWSSPVKRDSFAYSTPILLDLPGRKVLVGTSRNFIHVVDRADGTLLSAYRLEDIKYGYEHCNSVVHHKGYIYFVAAEEQGQGCVKLQLSEDGMHLKEVWRNPDVQNVFEGYVVHGNWLYTTLENKKLVCVDTESGRIRHSLRAESGNLVFADNKLIIYGHNGKVQFFSLKDGIPELRSEMRVRDGSGQHFSYPHIAAGMMYIRRGDALMAYALQ
jgi:outer membrane protein assembly factor BamB